MSGKRLYTGSLESTYDAFTICVIFVFVLASNGLDFSYLIRKSYIDNISFCILTLCIVLISFLEYKLHYHSLCNTYRMQVSRDSKIISKTFYASLIWIVCSTILFYLINDFMQYYYVSHIVGLSMQCIWLYLCTEISINAFTLFDFVYNKSTKKYLLLGE